MVHFLKKMNFIYVGMTAYKCILAVWIEFYRGVIDSAVSQRHTSLYMKTSVWEKGGQFEHRLPDYVC